MPAENLAESLVHAWRAALDLNEDGFAHEIKQFMDEFEREGRTGAIPDDVETIDRVANAYQSDQFSDRAIAVQSTLAALINQVNEVTESITQITSQERAHNKRRTQDKINRERTAEEYIKNIPVMVVEKGIAREKEAHALALQKLDQWYRQEMKHLKLVG
eukprot:CFRG8320T1